MTGDLRGRGTWTLTETAPNGTHVRFDWRVYADRPLLKRPHAPSSAPPSAGTTPGRSPARRKGWSRTRGASEPAVEPAGAPGAV